MLEWFFKKRIVNMKGKRFSINHIKNIFKKFNLRLLSKEYVNAKTKLKYTCSKNHIINATLDSFKHSKNKCTKCYFEIKQKRTAKIKIKQIAVFMKKYSCKLLSKTGKNPFNNLKFQCHCGNITTIRWCNFVTRKQCGSCGLKNRSGKNHYCWIKDRSEAQLRSTIREKCYKLLKRKNLQTIKNKKTKEMLGYTYSDLYKHIINHPNWINIKKNKWHIDHIYPIKAFLDYNIHDPKIINSLKNLQPLTAKENLKKGKTYNRKDFEMWLKQFFV